MRAVYGILALVLLFLGYGFSLWLMGPSAFPAKKPPHIIFIYADDLGWNDVSFHGTPIVPTPNIDALAMSGHLLNNYYSNWLCTPSRGSLMTGKYAIRLGLQSANIKCGEASALPSDIKTLPQHLKNLNYKTHMIGKWHLGCMTKDHLPTRRGFDTFFGFCNAYTHYYDYTHKGVTDLERTPFFFGVDLFNGTHLVKNYRDKYVTTLYTEKAEDIIANHENSQPLFLYMAHAAINAGGGMLPFEAPPEYVDKMKHIKDMNKRIMAGATLALDDSVGKVFQALHKKKMLENSIIVFASDNGGEVNPDLNGASSNFPFRGNKHTLWEGGIRVPSLIYSHLLGKPGIRDQLMHVSDWLPTLYRAAGGNSRNLGNIDGISMWEALKHDQPSPRTKLLHNIDPTTGVSALRKLDLKIVNGTSDSFNWWYNPTPIQLVSPDDKYKSINEWVFSFNSSVRDILIVTKEWRHNDPEKWRRRAMVNCTHTPPNNYDDCFPNERPCLFNITADPCEYYNLANTLPGVLEEMMEEILAYQQVSKKPQSKPSDRRADPTCHNFTYVPWLEREFYTECTYSE